MAANHHDHDVPAMDYAEHEKTYSLFGALMKWGTVFSVIALLITGALTSLIGWPFALIVSVATFAVVAKFF